MDSILSQLSDGSVRRIIGHSHIRDVLIERNLDVDDDGFIVDASAGEAITPYAYDRHKFQSVESPVDDPGRKYFSPEPEVTTIIKPKDSLHLSDLHSFVRAGGEYKPVRDDSLALTYFHSQFGFVFLLTTTWSDFRWKVDYDGSVAVIDHPSLYDNEISLTCFQCGFSNPPEEWDEPTYDIICPNCKYRRQIDTDQAEADKHLPCDECETTYQLSEWISTEYDLICPDCGGNWDNDGISVCTCCTSTHWNREIEHTRTDMLCPDCGSGMDYLHEQSRYDQPPGVDLDISADSWENLVDTGVQPNLETPDN